MWLPLAFSLVIHTPFQEGLAVSLLQPCIEGFIADAVAFWAAWPAVRPTPASHKDRAIVAAPGIEIVGSGRDSAMVRVVEVVRHAEW